MSDREGADRDMSYPIVMANSSDNKGDAERREKAAFQLTVFAVVNEPAYQVTINPSEKYVTIDFSERSYGGYAHGDDEVLQLTFGDPATLLALSGTLSNAGYALTAMLADTTKEAQGTSLPDQGIQDPGDQSANGPRHHDPVLNREEHTDHDDGIGHAG